MPSAPTVGSQERAEVRALGDADVPTVARLFKTIFRPGSDVALPVVEAYIRSVFLDGLDHDPACPSKVHVTPAGDVTGFIGSLSQPMMLGERRIKAAHACCLMVADPSKDALAGARLLRSFVNDPNDLSFSETASALSRRMWTSVGGNVAPGYSMKWLRLLRPVGTALALSQRRLPLAVLAPLGAFVDRLAVRGAGRSWWEVPSANGVTASVIDHAEMVDVVQLLAARLSLRPAWSAAQLARRLAHAEHMPAFGQLVCSRVTGRKGALLGAYLYYARRNEVAVVLQILVREGAAQDVVSSLIRDAHERGAVALSGRTEPNVLEALLNANCILVPRGATTVHSRDPAVLAAIARGEAMLTGLAGESWSQLIGGLTETAAGADA